LEKEQKRKRKNKKEERGSHTKAKCISKYWRSTMAIVAIALNMAKEAEISVDINRAYSNRRSRENKYYNSISTTVVDRVCTKMQPIYHGGG